MKLRGFRPSTQGLWITLGLALLCLSHDLFLSSATQLVDSTKLMLFLFVLWLVTAFVDFWVLSRRPPQMRIERRLPNNISVNVPIEISIKVENLSKANDSTGETYRLAIADLQPDSWEHQDITETTYLPPDSQQVLTYTTIPRKRGAYSITGTQCRITSTLGLWQLDWFYEARSDAKVFPDFRMLHDLSGLQGSATLQQEGLRKYQKRGTGMDFKQLRDYREGESLKQIDWRATSRFNKLIAREFQDEKNQSVIIMLDAGQRMMVQDEQLNYFDYALNTLIALSHTILKNGDELSLMSFGQTTRWLGKVKGVNNISQVLNHFFDLYPKSIASDYLLAATQLMEKYPKRSLVILVSCLRDEDFEDLLLAVQLLQKNHLVAVASIEDDLFRRINQTPVNNSEDAGLWLASQDFVDRIEHNRKKLEARGVICLSAPAANITPSTINTYLKVKRAGML